MTMITCFFDRAQWRVYFGFIHTQSANAEGVVKTAEQIIIARVWSDHIEIIQGFYLGELAILPAPDAEQVAHHIALLLPVQLGDVLVSTHPGTPGKRRLWNEWMQIYIIFPSPPSPGTWLDYDQLKSIAGSAVSSSLEEVYYLHS